MLYVLLEYFVCLLTLLIYYWGYWPFETKKKNFFDKENEWKNDEGKKIQSLSVDILMTWKDFIFSQSINYLVNLMGKNDKKK